MATKWTDKQLDVINTRDRNILVSAAAGSGKTAVLVERIIKLITDENNPLDIDKLLVVTFTKAAASEMKERVREALDKIAEENPGNAHIEKQLSYINTAKITTIDSFCASVVRENFEKVDLDPDFRIGDEGEISLIKSDVIEEMLTEYYENANEDFMELSSQFSAIKSDDNIVGLIEELYSASTSHENPEKWVKSCVDNYNLANVDELMNQPWMIKNIQRAKLRLQGIEENLKNAIRICNLTDGPIEFVAKLQEFVNQIMLLISKESYTAIKNSMDDFKVPALPRKTEANTEKVDIVKTLRKEAMDSYNDLKKTTFLYEEQEIFEEITGSKKQVETIVNMTLDFMKRFKEAKTEKGIMDFSDQEHYTLEILTAEDENGNLVPSDIAKQMALQYKEIMIDEYQDSNSVQEAVLTSISNGYGIDNVFMVGDVKQSIYRFRLANPNLFLDKYDTYSENSEDNHYKIILDKNFRSRGQVIDSVNYIFDTIMCRHTGGIEYIDNNRLVRGATYCNIPQDQDNSTEIVLIDGDKRFEMEQIARKIKEIVDPKSGMKVMGKDNELRAARYSDIVILLRGIKGVSNQYVEVLENYGIPAFTETKTGFYDAKEVITILNYLNIVDNPRQDIPLAGVLMTPIFSLDEEMLTEIKVCSMQTSLFDALNDYKENGDDEVILGKLENFFNQLSLLRRSIPYTTVYDMIDEILNTSGYGNYISALPSGKRRIKNIEMLKEKAVAYENSSYSGLFNFIRYIERIKADNEEGEAISVDENDNIVRIMSIHKSKGLQFPIVFLANAAGQFRPESDAIAIHEKYGIGVDYVDYDLKTKKKSVIKNVIRNVISEEDKAELLRLLYVAITRAQEKLFITGCVNDINKYYEFMEYSRIKNNLQASNADIISCNNFMKWILLAVSRNKAADEICEFANTPENLELYNADASIKVSCIFADEDEDKLEEIIELVNEKREKEQLLSIRKDQVFDDVTRTIISNNLSWRYPYEKDINISAKASVTEIKRQSNHDTDEQQDGAIPFKGEKEELIPDFAKSDEMLNSKLTGANRGTAYHKIFELIDMEMDEYSEESVKKMIDRFLDEGKIDKPTAEVIVPEDIVKFTNSQLFARMKAAHNRGELFREQKFLLGVKACEVNPENNSDELVIIQGIIDVCFIEDGKYVIADYKTDKVRDIKALDEKYHVQLDYYKKAIEQISEMEVTEKIIYSVTLSDELSI